MEQRPRPYGLHASVSEVDLLQRKELGNCV